MSDMSNIKHFDNYVHNYIHVQEQLIQMTAASTKNLLPELQPQYTSRKPLLKLHQAV